MSHEDGILVRAHDLHKVFFRGSERIDVLQGLNLEIPRGDFLALMGPSGSGKTTLLNLLGGLDGPSEGSIERTAQREQLDFEAPRKLSRIVGELPCLDELLLSARERVGRVLDVVHEGIAGRAECRRPERRQIRPFRQPR